MSTRQPTFESDPAVTWAGLTNLVIGAWLALSPWTIGYSVETAVWNNLVCGAAVAVFATFRMARRRHHGGFSWINLLLGIWLVIAPFATGYELRRQVWDSVAAGIVVALLALTSIVASGSRHRAARV